MNKALQMTAIHNSLQYWQRIKSLFGSSLIGYWPLAETTGAVVNDYSGNARNGAYVGAVDLANTTSYNHKPAPFFDGTTKYANVYSAALASAFNGSQLTVGGWYKPQTMLTWNDGVLGNVFRFLVDGNNYVDLLKSSTANLFHFRYTAGAVAKAIYFYGGTPNWFFWAITVDKAGDTVSAYINSKLVGTASSLGVWSGAISSAASCIGMANTTPANPLTGYVSDVFVLNKAASAAEIAAAAQLSRTTIGILGDSISYRSNTNWTTVLLENMPAAFTSNHAAGAENIMSNMDAQTVAAASDDADIIIVGLGTNDDNAGDMGALQAEYEENIAELKLSNTNATIYAMNVLPRWTDVGGGTPVDKSNIRTAIAAACTAQSITCWDTYTTPWIVVGDTSDGTHPTAAGHIKIAAQVLARI